jgi:hypothetical protein
MALTADPATDLDPMRLMTLTPWLLLATPNDLLTSGN